MKIKIRNTKLTIEHQVKLITDYNAGMPIVDIMKKYKVSRATIYNIRNKYIN
jgi:Mor family transcriptional regulator